MKRIELVMEPQIESELRSIVKRGKRAVREVTRAQV